MSGAIPNSRNPGCTVQKSISDNLPFLEFGSGTPAGPQSTKNSRAQGNPRAVRSSIQHTPPWLERRDPNQNTLIPASTTPFPFSGTSLCQFTGVFKLITTSLGSSFVRCHFSSARCVVTVRSLTDRPASVCQRSMALGPRLACRESLTTGNQSISQPIASSHTLASFQRRFGRDPGFSTTNQSIYSLQFDITLQSSLPAKSPDCASIFFSKDQS